MADRLIIQDKPELIAPYILVGLKGWLNAGEVSTGSIDYLRRKLGARPFASHRADRVSTSIRFRAPLRSKPCGPL